MSCQSQRDTPSTTESIVIETIHRIKESVPAVPHYLVQPTLDDQAIIVDFARINEIFAGRLIACIPSPSFHASSKHDADIGNIIISLTTMTENTYRVTTHTGVGIAGSDQVFIAEVSNKTVQLKPFVWDLEADDWR